MHGVATLDVVRLAMPYDAASLTHAARLIRASTASVDEDRVRSIIAGINQRENVYETSSIESVNDLVVTSWMDLTLDGKTDLGLELGKPEWGRVLEGDIPMVSKCGVHAVDGAKGIWEVMVGLEEVVMQSLLGDDSFMSFVVRVV